MCIRDSHRAEEGAGDCFGQTCLRAENQSAEEHRDAGRCLSLIHIYLFRLADFRERIGLDDLGPDSRIQGSVQYPVISMQWKDVFVDRGQYRLDVYKRQGES